jgi:hypothetical protein
MFSRIILVTFVGGILVGAAVHGPAPRVLAQPAAVEAPKWDLGDRWTWQRGSDEIIVTVAGTTGGYAVQEKIGSSTSMYHYASDFSSADVHFSQFQFPLTLGKAWMYRIEGTASNGQPAKWNISRKVEGMESVTVPAGTFDVVRISGRHCNVAKGNCGDFVVWYAPKAKNAARIITANADYWPGSLRGFNQVLVSYEVHNP